MLRARLLVAILAGIAVVSAAPAYAKPEVRSALTRVDGAADPDASGEIRVGSEPDRDRHSLEVKATSVDSSIEHRLYMGDAQDSLQPIGALEPRGNNEVRYRVRTKDGDSLPFGAETPAELTGRRVEVRQVVDSLEQPLLEGTVGSGAGAEKKARIDLDPTDIAAPRSRARLTLRSRPSKGDERLQVDATRLDFTSGQDYHLFMEDPDAPGTLQDVGALVRRGESSQARFRRRTKDGDALPFGVASVVDLAGLMVEVRDAVTDAVYFQGLVP